MAIQAFGAGGWWVGLSVASVLIAVLAALVVTVITPVNRIERQAGSILDHLTVTAAPQLDRATESLRTLRAGASS